MRWTMHVDQVVARCRGSLYILGLLKKSGVDNEGLRLAYNAFVFSHISYAWPALCDIGVTETRRLLSIHQMAKRFIGPLQDDLLLRLDKICVRLMRRIEQNSNHILRDFFEEKRNVRELRNSKHLIPPRCNTERFRKSFIHFAL